MAEEVIVFIHDGIVEGVFATSADTHVCIVDFDKDSGDQNYENDLWATCGELGLNLIGPEFDHCDGV